MGLYVRWLFSPHFCLELVLHLLPDIPSPIDWLNYKSPSCCWSLSFLHYVYLFHYFLEAGCAIALLHSLLSCTILWFTTSCFKSKPLLIWALLWMVCTDWQTYPIYRKGQWKDDVIKATMHARVFRGGTMSTTELLLNKVLSGTSPQQAATHRCIQPPPMHRLSPCWRSLY